MPSGAHDHPEYALTASVDDQLAILRGQNQALDERVTALEALVVDVEPGPEPQPPPSKYLWQADYSGDSWWADHGVIGVAHQQGHDLATKVTDDPFNRFGDVVRVDCLPGTVLDSPGTTYGITDRCGFAEMGLCDVNAKGLAEFYWKGYFALPANWCDSEDDVRWRTRTGSYKLLNTFGSFDPARGSGSQPYSNNFAALAWASNLGAIVKGPPGATEYDRDRARPSTFFSVARAAKQTRQPTPNGQAVSMIQIYYHLNPNPNDMSGIGSAAKPYVFIERGVWHSLETYIRVNSAGQANGEYKAWWDGQLAMHVNDLQLMPSIQRGINVWHNQYFHGGPEGCDTRQTMFLGPAAIDSQRLVGL